ncbi:MAG: molecular chaperone TorD family protein [Anaerolineae bacterium]|nr:molecular chaperone TorD family protein [Anaerolineae bacterium]
MVQPELEQWVEPLIAHHLAYTFFGKVFYEPPSGDLMRSIAADNLFAEWPLPASNARMERALEMLQSVSKGWTDDQLPDLKRDYARLFIGPGELLAVPWESVYRDPDGLIFDEKTLEVRRMYQGFGMAVPNPGREPEDHIGLEMRFVAYLSALGLQAIQTEQADRLAAIVLGMRTFLESHLGQWADLCLDRVLQHAETPYYRGVAELAAGSVLHSMAWLAEWIGEPADE